MFYDFALEHAWLIPLLPAMAFVIIGMITRSYGKLSAAIAVCMSFISFLLSSGVTYALVNYGISVEQPFVQQLNWMHIGSVSISMGVLIDPLTAMMLMVVSTVSLLVQIYSVGYMKGDKGYGRFFAFLSLFATSATPTVMAKTVISCPVRSETTVKRLKATKLIFTALSISSIPMRIAIILRFASAP